MHNSQYLIKNNKKFEEETGCTIWGKLAQINSSNNLDIGTSIKEP